VSPFDREPGRSGKILFGLFVGGASRRMNGIPKGLLLAPDTQQPLVVRTLDFAHRLGLDAALVGHARAYHSVVPDVPVLQDRPAGIGPLGGLMALVSREGTDRVIALACDMPYLNQPLLQFLAHTPMTADVLAARRSDSALWEPLCAAYRTQSVRPILAQALDEGVRSFQKLFERLNVQTWTVDDSQQKALTDWDTPEDCIHR
jgi:molybdenum cofactor guanylyltransferase